MSCCPVGACDCALESSGGGPTNAPEPGKTWENAGSRERAPAQEVVGILPADPAQLAPADRREESVWQRSPGKGRTHQQAHCRWQL